jgi:hypothetical protein
MGMSILLAENRFLHAAKGAKNTKEKTRQWFTEPEPIVL